VTQTTRTVPAAISPLLWMILGFLIVSSVLVVSLGRLGDMLGRVKMYNLGFVIYTGASLVLTVDPLTGQGGALWLIIGRLFQGVGAAFLVANSAAILTDAFPSNQRGLALGIMVGITYGIEPANGNAMGWTSLPVISLLAAGVASLVAFAIIESRVSAPMFRLPLFKIRAFTFGTLATFLSSIGRGGLMFMLIIWLQGIWLPLHGFSFEQTPVWAGILMLPLTIGFLIAGPLAGYLSDRLGARYLATGGMTGAAACFLLLMLVPVNFKYWGFATILLFCGISMGAFSSPNRAAVMNSIPPAIAARGAA